MNKDTRLMHIFYLTIGMRVLIKISCIVLILVFITGCLKEYSYEGGPPDISGRDSTANLPVKSEWEFKKNGTLFHGPVDTAWLSSQDNGQIISATGTAATGNGNIYLHIKSLDGPIRKGKTYTTTRHEIKFIYSTGLDTTFSAIPYRGGDIYLTVTDIAKDRIVGTFKGLAEDRNKMSVEILDGKFSSPLKEAPQTEAKGYLMLWAKENCNGPIKVKVNNQRGEIMVFSGFTPECGDPGQPTYTLPPGIYDWMAYCGRDSVYGKAEVKKATCTKILITFPFKPPPFTETNNRTCKISDVSYRGCLFTRCSPYNESYKPIANGNRSSYFGNTVSTMTYTTFTPYSSIERPHPVVYEGNKIIVDGGTKDESYFITDAQGRVTTYHGLKDPATVFPLDSIIINYEYDNNNNLVKRTEIDARYLAAKKETVFIWQDGNVVKIIEKNLTGGGQSETDFEYYTDKNVRALPFIFINAFELLLYQPVANFGNYMKNPIKKQTIHAFSRDGTPVLNSYDYLNYILDDNNYVLHLTVTNYGSSTDFSFTYKCF